MATVEKSGSLKYKSQSGDTTIFYPNTLKENVSGMEEIDAHIVDTNNPHNVTAEQVGALSSTPITMASTDGVTYTCTVPGISALTAGASFIGIPALSSTNTAVKLNVNGLGEKLLRRRTTINSTTTNTGYSNDWLASGKPLRIMYDGTFWVVDMARPYAADLMGTVSIANGGTGATDGATGLANLFAAGSTVLSSNQYGDTLPDAGTAGRVFFKKGDPAATVQTNLDSHTGNTTMHTTAAERTAWNAKQDALTFDTTPTSGSTNPVTSGGVKAALDGKVSQPVTITSAPTNTTVGEAGQIYILTKPPYSEYICHGKDTSTALYKWRRLLDGLDVDGAASEATLRYQYFVSNEATPGENYQIAWLLG